jgi:hypothetical protein
MAERNGKGETPAVLRAAEPWLSGKALATGKKKPAPAPKRIPVDKTRVERVKVGPGRARAVHDGRRCFGMSR